MKVRLSRRAFRYVEHETAYLRQYSRHAADHFLRIVSGVQTHLAQFGEAGFAEPSLPIRGSRRLIRNGYRFDYQIRMGLVEITTIASSVNTPLAGPSDDPDFDYET